MTDPLLNSHNCIINHELKLMEEISLCDVIGLRNLNCEASKNGRNLVARRKPKGKKTIPYLLNYFINIYCSCFNIIFTYVQKFRPWHYDCQNTF